MSYEGPEPKGWLEDKKDQALLGLRPGTTPPDEVAVIQPFPEEGEVVDDPVFVIQPVEEADLASLSKDELKDLARERGLAVGGTKKELIERLSE